MDERQTDVPETSAEKRPDAGRSIISVLTRAPFSSVLFPLSGVGLLLAAYGFYIVKITLNVFGIPTYLVGFNPHLFAETAVSFLLLLADSVLTLPVTVFFTPGTLAVIIFLAGIVYLAAAARALGFVVEHSKYVFPLLDAAAIICFFVTYVYSVEAIIGLTDKSTMPMAGRTLGENIIKLNTITAGLSLISSGYFILVVECLLAPNWKTFNRSVATAFVLLLVASCLHIPQFFGAYSAFYAALPVVETAGREYLLLIRSNDRIFLYDRENGKIIVREVKPGNKYVIKGYERRAEYVSPTGGEKRSPPGW